MVTSTSTPGSIEMEVICLTISEGEWRSITLLWILIWNLSQVLEPSPQGVFLVVILRVLVGILTGPFTFSSFSLAPCFNKKPNISDHNITCLWTSWIKLWSQVLCKGLRLPWPLKWTKQVEQLLIWFKPKWKWQHEWMIRTTVHWIIELHSPDNRLMTNLMNSNE